MSSWSPADSIVRLIDKENSTPTGINIAGFLTGGDLIATDLIRRIVLEEGDGKIPNAILYLDIDTAGHFLTTAPILNDKEAANSYLLEIKIAKIIDGVTYYNKLQRYRLSQPSIVEDKDLGLVIQLPCENIAYQMLRENYISLNEELNSTPEGLTPFERAEHIISFYIANAGSDGIIIGTFNNNLPNDTSLKQDWFLDSPVTFEDAISEIISRTKQPGALGGVFKNFYYSVDADPDLTNFVNLTIDEFGAVDSGITINPTNQNASLLDRTIITSDKKRKNYIIVRYHPRGASLPMDKARFASKFLSAKFRPEWVSNFPYAAGALVKQTITATTPYTIRFFQALNDVQSVVNPNSDSTNWLEDFTVIPTWNTGAYYTPGEVVTVVVSGNVRWYQCTVAVGPTGTDPTSDGAHWLQIFTPRPQAKYTEFETYTPYTADLETWKTNLADYDSPPSGYLGFALDWNFERQVNDLLDYTDRFGMVSGKSVRAQQNAPPTGRELFHGSRYLVGTSPTGAWAGKANYIAEYDNPLFGSSSWKFSVAPVNGDMIFMVGATAASILKFNGSSWVNAWTSSDNGKPSPYHAVKDMRLCKSATEIPGQAIEFRFNWKDSLDGGNDINRSSRGAWINFFYPYPRFDAPGGTHLGHYYGGNGTDAPTNPEVNHQNLNLTTKGKIGWNRGIESEDMGRLSAHTFKVRLGFFRSSDDSTLYYAMSNMAMVYWRKDENGRFFFKDFIIPENYQWTAITIPLPPFSAASLYFNKLDELAQVLGFTLPYDFFVKERDYSGVQYEWKKNQAWGVFMKGDVYNGIGMYQGCYDDIFDDMLQRGSQLIPNYTLTLEYIKTGNWAALQALYTNDMLIDHTWIGIDEVNYIKEGYAIYPQEGTEEPRTDIVQLMQETNYLTALAKAQATYIEDQFFPNERYVTCTGDPRIEYGKLITETGSRVPGGSQESAIALQKTIIDNRGFNQELYLIRKFVI